VLLAYVGVDLPRAGYLVGVVIGNTIDEPGSQMLWRSTSAGQINSSSNAITSREWTRDSSAEGENQALKGCHNFALDLVGDGVSTCVELPIIYALDELLLYS
jgi:hypothetical protein